MQSTVGCVVYIVVIQPFYKNNEEETNFFMFLCVIQLIVDLIHRLGCTLRMG